MILQALVAYYDRLAREGKIASLGWTYREIGWVVYLNPDGSVKAFTSTYETVTRTAPKGKTHTEEVAKCFRVPAGEHKQGINPRLLWDNPEYALGIPKIEKDNTDKDKEKKKQEDAKAKCAAFAQRIAALNCDALAPILRFLENENKLTDLEKCSPDQFHAFMQEVEKPKGSTLITFRLVGDGDVVCTREDVREAYDKQLATFVQGDSLCIVSGERGTITKTTAPIALRNGQSSGCRLVAFQKNSGFDSYHKEQGGNAPISETSTFKYSAALSALLQSNDHSMNVGDETLLFWASQANPVETAFADLFGYHADEADDSGAIALKGILTAAQKGQLPGFEDKERFWLLLLQPVSARIAVRLWVEQTPTQHVSPSASGSNRPPPRPPSTCATGSPTSTSSNLRKKKANPFPSIASSPPSPPRATSKTFPRASAVNSSPPHSAPHRSRTVSPKPSSVGLKAKTSLSSEPHSSKRGSPVMFHFNPKGNPPPCSTQTTTTPATASDVSSPSSKRLSKKPSGT